MTTGPTRQEMGKLLTLKEAASRLRCSKAHLCNILNGKVPGLPRLPHIALGRRKVIRLCSLEDWMAKAEAHQL